MTTQPGWRAEVKEKIQAPALAKPLPPKLGDGKVAWDDVVFPHRRQVCVNCYCPARQAGSFSDQRLIYLFTSEDLHHPLLAVSSWLLGALSQSE